MSTEIHIDSSPDHPRGCHSQTGLGITRKMECECVPAAGVFFLLVLLFMIFLGAVPSLNTGVEFLLLLQGLGGLGGVVLS